jgi:acyl-CoA synthetase (AMP-forming)/AMP-acid ligase II
MTSLAAVFERAAQENQTRIALVEENQQWTFGEIADEVSRVAATLRERVKGNTVGILLLNSQKFVTTLLGIWKAGKTAIPLNYLLPPADIGFIIRDSAMSALISSQFFAPQLGGLRPLFGDQGVILMADEPGFVADSAAESDVPPRNPALILYTSGTTGRPKGVLLTHDNLAYNVASCQQAGEFDGRDSFLCLLPFFHTYAITGTILLPLFSGCKMVLVDRFVPLKVL